MVPLKKRTFGISREITISTIVLKFVISLSIILFCCVTFWIHFHRGTLILLLEESQNSTTNVYDEVANQCGTETFEECALLLGTYVQYALWVITFVYILGVIGILLIKIKRQLGHFMWISWFLYQFIVIFGMVFASLLLPGTQI